MSAIYAEDLGKAYQFYDRPIDSLKEWLLQKSYSERFWALRGVDLKLPAGSALGVIGENGAGKSTLLKLIVGTISPTTGTIRLGGRVSSILELGSGFHPDLTGRENIRIGCAALGLSPREADRKSPEIIAFSELEDFIDRPVKTYSSGMYARLGFSVATCVDPDILIVDEALAVGDQNFRKKSVDRMVRFREQGKTLVFCSHILGFVMRLCDHCLWLEGGRPRMFGPTDAVLDAYMDHSRARESGVAEVAGPAEGLEETEWSIRRRDVAVNLSGDCVDGVIATGGKFQVEIRTRITPTAAPKGVQVGLTVVRNDGIECFSSSAVFDGNFLQKIGGDKYGALFVADRLPLLSGQYSVQVELTAAHDSSLRARFKDTAKFRVVDDVSKLNGLISVPHLWNAVPS